MRNVSDSDQSRFWQRIQGKLILLLLTLLLPILLIQAYVYHERLDTRRAEEFQANLELARAAAQAFETFVKDILHQELSIGLALTSSQTLAQEDQNRILNGSKRGNSSIWEIFWSRPDGVVIAATGPQFIGMNLGDRDYFREVVSGREWTVSDLLLSRTTGRPSFTVSRGIRSDTGQLLGIVVAGILPEQLDHVLAIRRSKGGGHALVDRKGMLVYRYPAIEYPNWEQRNWLRDYPEFEAALNGNDMSKTVFAPFEGKNRLVSFTPVSFIGWAASAGRTEDIAMEGITSQFISEAVTFLLVALAAFGIALVLSRHISIPVKRLRDHAVVLGRGETNNPAAVSGPAELRELADSFNSMAEQLRSRETSLRDQREWLRVTLTSIGDAVLTTDTAGNITFLNPVAAALTGWRLEDAAGQPVQSVFRIINEKTRKPAEDIVARVLGEGCIVCLANHTALISRNGGEVPIEDSAASICDSSGDAIGVVLVFHDVTEKRRAQEALSEANRRLSVILESIADGFYALDAELRFTHANDAALRYFKRDKQDVLGKHIFDVFPDFQGSVFDIGYRRAMESGEPEHIEAPSIVMERTVEVYAYPSADNLTVLFRDITERKKMEEELRELSQRLSFHVDNSPLAVIEWGSDMRLIRWSGEAERIFGWCAEEVLGKRMDEFRWIYEEDEAQVAEVSSELVSGADPQRFSLNRNYHKDGSIIYCEWYNSSLLDDSGKLRSILSLVLDITERKQAETALQEAHNRVFNEKQRLEAVMDALPVGVAIMDGSGGHVRSNNAFDQVWSGPRPPVRSVDDYSAYEAWWCETGKPVQPEEWASAQAMLTGETVIGQIMRIARFDGSWTFVHNSASPIRDAHGDIVGSAVAMMDITGQKQMEEELRKSHDALELRVQERTAELSATIARLELLNQELQEFAYVASHDLQEPLRKIQTFCGMTMKRCSPVLDSTCLDYLERVLSSANRMRQLLHDLLKFSRVATRPEPFKEIDLAKIVWEAADVFEATIKETGCEIEIENLPLIEADESQMLQLFQNLIGNALKFRNSEKPLIKVYGKLEGKGVSEIYVEDNGIGFDRQFAELIFKPFERLHNRSEYEGTGMGLAICRKIVERHGGNIRTESEPGKGAIFIIRMPLKQTRLESIHGTGQRS